MTKALPQISPGSSRLVRFLSDLSATAVPVSHRQFTERLGQLIDFSDSISLSDAHARALVVENEEVAEFSDGVTREFLRARSEIIQSAMRSFFPGAGAVRLAWPLATKPPVEAAEAIGPYVRFYRLQQQNIDSKIRRLHVETRGTVGTLSVTLARICAIDEALSNALRVQNRGYFATVPALLEQRMTYLFEQYQHEVGDGKAPADVWPKTLEQFRREAQGLLLAEIEARLLPALGLIEALNEEIPDES